MVTDDERDYLWRTYAGDSRARINLGIRRRLAPLLENDRRKIELMNALLLSMPGTPVLYYGDEIGMGDNFYLGDRDGVRTPMQWSADRNGGFSRADPQRLYLPPIMDPVYGYQSVNVEAQQRSPSSLLNWMRRMIAVRKNALGVRPRRPATSSTRATARCWPSSASTRTRASCASSNLARSAQAVELDLAEFRGAVPVELMGSSAFPPDRRAALHADACRATASIGSCSRRRRSRRAGTWRRPSRRPTSSPSSSSRRWRASLAGRERSRPGARRAAGLPAAPALVRRPRTRTSPASRSTRRSARGPSGAHQTRLRWSRSRSAAESAQQLFPAALRRCGAASTCGPARRSCRSRWRRSARGARVGALLDAAQDERVRARAGRRIDARARALAASERRLRPTLGRDLGSIARRCGGAPGRRRAEQRLVHRRRAHHAEDLSAARAGHAARARGGPLPDRGRRLSRTRRRCSARSSMSAGRAETPPLAAAFAFVRQPGRRLERRRRGARPRRSTSRAEAATMSLRAGGRAPYVFPHRHRGQPRAAHGRAARAFATPTDDPAFEPEPIAADDLARWVDGDAREAENAFAVLQLRERHAAGERRPSSRPHARRAARALSSCIDALRVARRRRREDAHPRRLPSGPGAGRAGRRHDHRLRGRAVAPARGAAGQDLAAARRRRHAALVRLRRIGRARPLCSPHRRRAAPRRRGRAPPGATGPAATSSQLRGCGDGHAELSRTTRRRAAGCSISSCCRRRSTRSPTRRPTGPTGSPSRCAACSTCSTGTEASTMNS